MNSLERSLQAGLAACVLALMLAFWWSGTLAARLLTESFVERRLGSEAEALVASLERAPFALARPRLLRPPPHPAYDRPLSGRYFVLRFDAGGEIRSRSAWEQPFELPRLVPGQRATRRATGAAGEPLLLWLGGYSRAGRGFTVAVAEDIGPIEARLEVFQWAFAAGALALLAALLLVQRLILRRSARRLDAIRGDIERLEHGEAVGLSEDVPAEVMPLVREFNRLLLRFDERTKQSRNTVGNLAHALKGPLNLLLRAAESPPAAADGATRLDESTRRAVAQNVRLIHRLIESELKRARVAGRGAVGQRFDLETELPALAGLLGQVYADKGVALRWRISDGVELAHDRQDMLELIGNLLDNAVKWARATVLLSARAAGAPRGGTRLDVEDDGPGCSDDEIARLTERGVRLDESVAGHGLGLAIVKDIVATYDGRLELGRSVRLGGLRATVLLPGRGGRADPTRVDTP